MTTGGATDVANVALAARRKRPSAWVAVAILAMAAASWLGLEALKENDDARRIARIAALERQGLSLIENRRWSEADAIFSEIESLQPGSAVAASGRRGIEAGMDQERRQFVGYWLGQARAAGEAKQWEQAEAALQRVREKAPDHPELAEIETEIRSGREEEKITGILASARAAMEERRWEDAISEADRVLAMDPDHAAAAALATEILRGQEAERADRLKALELLAKARPLDRGVFNEEALEMLREAVRLDPANAEAAALFEKMASYTRTLRVPEEFPTLPEALAAANPGDRILVGEGIWKGPVILPVKVELQGAGNMRTIIECPADEGNAITLGAAATDSSVHGITFRHERFDIGSERFAVALVNGAGAAFTDCRFEQGSGHGLVVIDGGRAEVRGCRFLGNGWDGVAVYGAGSSLQMEDCFAEHNFGHGVDVWDGGSAVVEGCRIRANGRNGVLAQTGGGLSLRRNVCEENREFGIVLEAASAGEAEENVVRKNLLGGVVVRTGAETIKMVGNRCLSNQGPGWVLEKGVAVPGENETRDNRGEQVLAHVEFPEPELFLDPVPAVAPVDGELPWAEGDFSAAPRAVIVGE